MTFCFQREPDGWQVVCVDGITIGRVLREVKGWRAITMSDAVVAVHQPSRQEAAMCLYHQRFGHPEARKR